MCKTTFGNYLISNRWFIINLYLIDKLAKQYQDITRNMASHTKRIDLKDKTRRMGGGYGGWLFKVFQSFWRVWYLLKLFNIAWGCFLRFSKFVWSFLNSWIPKKTWVMCFSLGRETAIHPRQHKEGIETLIRYQLARNSKYNFLMFSNSFIWFSHDFLWFPVFSYDFLWFWHTLSSDSGFWRGVMACTFEYLRHGNLDPSILGWT